MHATVPQPIKALTVTAVVTRCGCSDEQKASPQWHALEGEPCPRPRAVEDRGVIVRWNRNPLRQAINAMRRVLGRI